jgi:hypothetical protein
MGAWGTAISSNDTYADVYADFFDAYNKGESVEEISRKLIAKNQSTINDPKDCSNFWFALAKAQWECKQLDDSVFQKVQSIISEGTDLTAWKNLGAEDKDVKKRKAALDKFNSEISSERPKAKPRKKTIIREPAFAKGDCITFKLKNGNYGGAIVLEAIYNTPYPHNLIAVTRINNRTKPSADDFLKSHVLLKDFAAWDNKPCINWLSSTMFKKEAHLFEKIGNAAVELNYDHDATKTPYGFAGNFEIFLIEVTNRQFEHEIEGNKPNLSITVKSLIQKSKWNVWPWS